MHSITKTVVKVQQNAKTGEEENMKKKIFVLIMVSFALLYIPNVYGIIGPIPLNEANSTSMLPDGEIYGSVTISLLPNFCPGSYDGVKIVVDVNQNILTPIPGAPYGVQAFGFNYGGNPSELSFIGLPLKWSTKTSQNMSEFGVFLEDVYDTRYRQDPLTVNICNCCSDLTEGDFVVKNTKGYVFATHIAGFTYPGVTETSSAFFGTVETTLIELSDFVAKPGNKKVTVQWNTASEIDNVGFNIYRAESRDGEYVKINDALIAAQGSSTQGAAYTFIDRTVQNRKTYYYKLQDVDIEGKSTFNGPASTTPRWIFGILK
jgi:hypothetical protein